MNEPPTRNSKIVNHNSTNKDKCQSSSSTEAKSWLGVGIERPPAPKIHQKSRWWWWWWFSAAIVFSLSWVFWGKLWNQNSQPEIFTQARVQPVKTVKVEPVESYGESRTYTGNLVAFRSSNLSFERSGKVINIAVEAGERVVSGQVLASLDTRNLQTTRQQLLAEKAQALAQLAEMEAGPRQETIAAAVAKVRNIQEQLKLAKTKLSRREKLYQEGAISLEQLDEFDSNVNALQANFDEAQSQLQELQAGTRSEQIAAQKALLDQLDANIANLDLDLEKSQLTTPFSGTIAARLIDEGTTVASGQTVLELVENNKLEAHIGVPIATASRLKLNDTHKLQVGQKTYAAKITAILPTLDANTRTMTVVLNLDEQRTTTLATGQIAKLKLSEPVSTYGYWLPMTALVGGERGLWSCYVLGQPKDLELEAKNNQKLDSNSFRVERRDLEILYTESDRVLVRGTLEHGDRVIIEGNHRFVPGLLVSPVEK